ncbi:hypothetical protein KZP23_17250 [Echinicola marina]|uniref:hypothetical protein n=1 Tax=Echinicola marina TaxID=2859768 RepID=UPI001CF71880|nr:hypothetical protein [Echinicola marina]UCS92428.1 hypothetical protein KZP23_17250 [Echinicola marina]
MKEQNITDQQILIHLNSKKKYLLSELNKIELAIQAFKGNFNSKKEMESNLKKIEIPKKYNKNDKTDLKIAFVLSKLNRADKNEIVKEILNLEPDQDEKKLINNVSVRLSFLLKNNKIIAEKAGRNYIYFLE